MLNHRIRTKNSRWQQRPRTPRSDRSPSLRRRRRRRRSHPAKLLLLLQWLHLRRAMMVHTRALISRNCISKYNTFLRLYGYTVRESLRRNECLKAPTELAMAHGLDHSFGFSELSSPVHGSFFCSYPGCFSTIAEVWRTIDTCIFADGY